jgi:CheY-like chemotaxis protein
MMPVLDGPGMLRGMRNTPEFSDIPAIVMSSLPEPAVTQEASGLYQGFLRKPFRLRAVLELVSTILNQAR